MAGKLPGDMYGAGVGIVFVGWVRCDLSQLADLSGADDVLVERHPTNWSDKREWKIAHALTMPLPRPAAFNPGRNS
jgi:hypothetical protein